MPNPAPHSLTANRLAPARFRSDRRAPLRTMLAVQPPSRTFGGNVGRAVEGDEAEKSPDVWRHVKIPSSEFRPLIQRFAEPPEYWEVSRVLLSTFQVATKLEVAELMFEVP